MFMNPCVAGNGITINIVTTHVRAPKIPIIEIEIEFVGNKYPKKFFPVDR